MTSVNASQLGGGLLMLLLPQALLTTTQHNRKYLGASGNI